MITLDLELKHTYLNGNSGMVNECLLVCTTRWMQRMVMHIIDMTYVKKHVIIRKYVLFDNVCMTKQIFVKVYYDIFLKSILNLSNFTLNTGTLT
jgi:hypothetical protein